MSGWTVVLIDDEDGSEGDFVHVESFPDYESLLISYGRGGLSWQATLMEAARELAMRSPRLEEERRERVLDERAERRGDWL